MNYLGNPARNEVCLGSERKQSTGALERSGSVRFSFLVWLPMGVEGEDKGPGLLESLGWGRRAWRALECPGRVCAGLGLRICEGKGGCGTRLRPPSQALSSPEPTALPSAATCRSTTRCCLCSQDPSQWGTVDPGGYPGGKGANCREMGDHCTEGPPESQLSVLHGKGQFQSPGRFV